MIRFKKLIACLTIAALAMSLCAVKPTEAEAASKLSKYWIKVNKQANTATVYKKTDGKYKAFRAMVISSGGSKTPSGTFYTVKKYRWRALFGNEHGQYATRIVGHFLFHSVPYKKSGKKNTVFRKEYNKLGKGVSMGCIRMSTMDCKWVYENCRIGTKVTIYSSKNPGPLGKPTPIKLSVKRTLSWDPTDPDINNPIFSMKKPVITISSKKAKVVNYGKTYNLKYLVTAKNPNANQSITHLIRTSVQKYVDGKYRSAKFSTKSLGSYKITYTVNHKYSRKASKAFYLKVVDPYKPVITAAGRDVTQGDSNACLGVKVMQKSKNITASTRVFIKAPGESTFTEYSWAEAGEYVFDTIGTYTIKFKAKGQYAPYSETVKTIKINCLEAPPEESSPAPEEEEI